MTKDRQIVAMLLRRKRTAWRHLINSVGDEKYFRMFEYCEACNAAEHARRILYGTEL